MSHPLLRALQRTLLHISNGPHGCTARRLAEELLLLNRAALMARKQRMRDQLQQDYTKIQLELGKRGLAIASSID